MFSLVQRCFIVSLTVAFGVQGFLVIEHASADEKANWPQYLGPNQDGVSSEKQWTTAWPEDGPKKLWQINVGNGNASVAVVGDRLYTAGSGKGRVNDKDVIYCLDARSGKELWRYTYDRPERKTRTPTRQGPANNTPTIHNGELYHLSGDAQLFCLNAETGKVKWKRFLMAELGARHPQYDHAASPVIVNNLVVVPIRLPDASIMAFDKTNGKEAWRAYHKTRRGALGGFWSTPVFRRIDGRPCLVYLTGLAVVGLDPNTGKTQWKYDFVKHEIPLAERGAVASSAIVDGNRIFVPFHPDHNRGFSMCIEVAGGETKLLWKSEKLAHWFNNCVLYNGCVLGVDQGPSGKQKAGGLYCYDMKTGKLLWSTYDLAKESSRQTVTSGGTIMIAGGKLILLNKSAYLNIVDVSRTGYKLLATARAFRRLSSMWTSPVLAGGCIYCRNNRGDLVCYDVRK